MMRRVLGNCSIAVWNMTWLLQAASTVNLVDATLIACDNEETRRKSWSVLNGRQGGSLSSKLGLDWPQIDRFTTTQNRGVLVVKLLPRVTARGTTYVWGVGT